MHGELTVTYLSLLLLKIVDWPIGTYARHFRGKPPRNMESVRRRWCDNGIKRQKEIHEFILADDFSKPSDS